jgi:hypothetical protein
VAARAQRRPHGGAHLAGVQDADRRRHRGNRRISGLVQVAHRRRDLPVLAAAIGASALGDGLALLPLNLQLRSMGGSGLTVAALFIAVWSPAALLAAPTAASPAIGSHR